MNQIKKQNWTTIAAAEKAVICGGGFFAAVTGIAVCVGIGSMLYGLFSGSKTERKAKVKVKDWVDVSWENSGEAAVKTDELIEAKVAKQLKEMRAEIVDEVTNSVVSQHRFISRFYG